MTVKDNDTKTSSTSKKKSSTSSASTSKTTSKSSKVVGSTSTTKETVQSGNLSKSSSASSLQISDVSHLPVTTNVVTYVVTEALPTGSGEKITTYTDSGPTATEYRHFIAQDSTTQHSTDIQQIGSVLNQSISNLSQASGSTYTVTEPMEELKLTYNINDSAWNGKFVQEQTSSSKSHQESSSQAKSSSSSYAIEIVDGKERIVDQKHHETSHATRSSNDESLDMKTGTNIVPEVHYQQKSTESTTTMDSAVPELQQPKTKSSEAVKEIHQVGDEIITSKNIIKDNTKNVSSKHAISNKSKKLKDAVNKQSTSTQNTSEKQSKSGGASTVTTTTTYYDSKGNVIETSSDVNTTNLPGSDLVTDAQVLSNITDISNIRADVVDSTSTYGKVIKDNTINTTDVSSNDRIYGNARSQSSPDRKTKPRTESPSQKPKPQIQQLDDTTRYVDENYVDTSKIRNAQASSDSTNFYGHNVDSSNTVVKNTYDSDAIQNTIGYKGRVVIDQNIDDKNLVYSNDRNYGKTGWNGQFTYEKPQQSPADARKSKSPEKKLHSATKPLRKSPEDLPAAGAPSRKDKTPLKQVSPTKKTSSEDFISTETEEDIKQFTGDESSTTYIEGPTTIEYFKIVDGKEIPVGKKVIPGSITETHESSTKSDTNIPRDTKTITTRYRIVNGKKIPIPSNEDVVTSSEYYEYTTSSVDGSNIVQHYKIIDGKKFPLGPEPPHAPDSTTIENYETVSKTTVIKDGQTSSKDHYTIVDDQKRPEAKTVTHQFPEVDSTTYDSKSTVIKDSQTLQDKQSKVVHFTITGEKELPAAGIPTRKPKKPEDALPKKKPQSPQRKGKLHPEDFPAAGRPSVPDNKSPLKKRPGFPDVDSTTVVETFESVSNVVDKKSNIIKDSQTIVDTESNEEYYTIVDGQKIPSTQRSQKPSEEPTRKFPEELPAAGIPSRKPKKPEDALPTKKPESPQRKGKLHPEDLPAAGRPTEPQDKTLSSTTVQSFETVSTKFDSKTTVVQDSQTFVDKHSTEEHYTIVDGEKIPLGPIDTKPIEEAKPVKKFPEELPAAGVPSRKPKKSEDEIPKKKPESPHRKSKLHPEDLPAAGRPSVPDDKSPLNKRPDFPEVDSTTVVETFDSVPNVVDKKSQIIKDSQTLVDTESTQEYYTIVDGQKIPSARRDKKPVEDTTKKFPEELPAAGVPSRKPKGPGEENTKKKPHAPGKKEKIHPEDLPAAGRLTRPTKRPDFPEIDSTTTIESVSKKFDSKTTVVKDSQTFVDKQSTEEHYTVVDGEKIPGDGTKPVKKFPRELPAAGMPSRKPDKPQDETPKKKPESPHRKGKLHPEDYPAAGRPTVPDDKPSSPTKKGPEVPDVESTTVVETFESVSNVFDEKSKIFKDLQTFVDRESTEEYYTIVDGQRVPSVPVGEAKKPSPDELLAAGVPSRKIKEPKETPYKRQESPTKKDRLHPEDLPAAGRPTESQDKTLSSTTVQSVETVSTKFDSETTVVKDSQTFVDKHSTEEHYTIVDGEKIPLEPKDTKPIEEAKPVKKFPEELPAAGVPSRKPKKSEDEIPKKKPESPHRKSKLHPEDFPAAGRPSVPDDKSPLKKGPDFPDVDSTTVVETFESVSNIVDKKSQIIKDSQTFVDTESSQEFYTIVDGQKNPLAPRDKKPVEDITKKFPEELPAAGVPSRKPKRPDDESQKKKPDTSDKKDKIHPEDLPAAGKPSKPLLPLKKQPDFWDSNSTTVIENYGVVSNVFDSKTTIVKDSQTFVDKTSTEENYTVVDGQPSKPLKKSPEELPTAGVPSRKLNRPEEEKPKRRPESPHKHDRLHPEDFPAAGKPSQPLDKALVPKQPSFPETDLTTTTVESFETVSKVFDSKTTVIKDSQTFVDNQSSVEHYTIINGEKIPTGPKPIEEVPAAGVPSRKPKKPENKVAKKKPESPSRKEKLHPEDFPAAGLPTTKDKKPKDKPEDLTVVENYEIINQVVDVKQGVTEDVTSKTVVDKYVTDIRDVKDTVVTDTTDTVSKTFITENITDVNDINEVENITNIKKITDNKVIKIERVVKEPEPKGTQHYVVPLKEQCICELCICGTSTHVEQGWLKRT